MNSTPARTAIAVFSKIPVSGRVKTRLIGPLTPAEAAGLHRACLADACALVSSLPGCAKWLYVAGERDQVAAAARELRLAASWRVRRQTGRTLGERRARAAREMRCAGASRVVFIGADTPWMGRCRIQRAVELLRDADVALGPASDGGYYLMAARGSWPQLFRGIPWGSRGVLAASRRALQRAGLRVALLPADFDLDRPEDLARVEQMARRGKLGSPQLEKWLKKRKA